MLRDGDCCHDPPELIEPGTDYFFRHGDGRVLYSVSPAQLDLLSSLSLPSNIVRRFGEPLRHGAGVGSEPFRILQFFTSYTVL